MVGKKSHNPHAPVKGRRKAANRSALLVIAILFLASGALRLGEHGVAIAQEVAALADQSGSTKMNDAVCETDADIARVLAILHDRERALAEREDALEDRLQALNVAENQFQKNMVALVAAENALKATMALADGAAENDLSQLTKVYESMKPKQAIPLFAQMDPQFAAGFLGRMRADTAGAIMSGLEPQKAYAISVILAGRNANVPTN